MEIICRACRRNKSLGHKRDCPYAVRKSGEVWIDSFSNRIVTDVPFDYGSSSNDCTNSHDTSSSGSCDSGSF